MKSSYMPEKKCIKADEPFHKHFYCSKELRGKKRKGYREQEFTSLVRTPRGNKQKVVTREWKTELNQRRE